MAVMQVHEIVKDPFVMQPGMKACGGPSFKIGATTKLEVQQPIGFMSDVIKLDQALKGYGVYSNNVVNDLAWLSQDGVIRVLRVNHPSGWDPSEKLGSSFIELHSPLPSSAATLKTALPKILTLIISKWYERSVWTITPNSHYDQRPQKKAEYIAAQKGWDGTLGMPSFRYEHQYVGPAGGGILFVINVNVMPLSLLKPTERDLIRRSIESMAPDVLAYKGLDHPSVLQCIKLYD